MQFLSLLFGWEVTGSTISGLSCPPVSQSEQYLMPFAYTKISTFHLPFLSTPLQDDLPEVLQVQPYLN